MLFSRIVFTKNFECNITELGKVRFSSYSMIESPEISSTMYGLGLFKEK